MAKLINTEPLVCAPLVCAHLREPLQISLKPQASKHKNVLDYMREKRGFSQPGKKPMNILDRARLLRSRK